MHVEGYNGLSGLNFKEKYVFMPYPHNQSLDWMAERSAKHVELPFHKLLDYLHLQVYSK